MLCSWSVTRCRVDGASSSGIEWRRTLLSCTVSCQVGWGRIILENSQVRRRIVVGVESAHIGDSQPSGRRHRDSNELQNYLRRESIGRDYTTRPGFEPSMWLKASPKLSSIWSHAARFYVMPPKPTTPIPSHLTTQHLHCIPLYLFFPRQHHTISSVSTTNAAGLNDFHFNWPDATLD